MSTRILKIGAVVAGLALLLAATPWGVQAQNGIQRVVLQASSAIIGTVNLGATDNAVLDDIADGIAVTASNLDVQIGGSDTVAVSNAGLTELAAAINSSQVDVNIAQMGGSALVASGCEDQTKVQNVPISVSSSGNNELVAIDGSKVVYVCGYTLMAAGDVVVQWITGTGTACATSETDEETLTFDDVAGHAITRANGGAAQLKGDAGDALCVELSGSVGVTGSVTYVQQ